MNNIFNESIKNKFDSSGGDITGDVNMTNNKIINLGDPVDDHNAVNKRYVDAGFTAIESEQTTQNNNISNNSTAISTIESEQTTQNTNITALQNDKLDKSGGTMTGALIVPATIGTVDVGTDLFNVIVKANTNESSIQSNDTDIANLQADKVNKAGDTMTGELNMNNNKVRGVASGTFALDAVNLTQLETVANTKAGRTVSTDNPTSGDDVNDGYSIGDIWVNEEGTQSFICVNNSVDAAEWELFGNDQSLNTNDSVSFTSVDTPAISSGTSVAVSSPLIVDSTIKLKSTILDNNGDEAYILKKQSGANSYAMGNLADTGTGDNNVSIGYDVGNSTQTGYSNVVIGNNAGKSANYYDSSVIIGTNCGNNSDPSWIGNVVIGSDAGNNPKNGVFIGYRAGFSSTGVRNICIGYNAGQGVTSAPNCTFIGWGAGTINPTIGEQMAIGYTATCTNVNQIVMGGVNVTQFWSNAFRDLDVRFPNVLAIGKNNATKVEIAKTGVTTEVKGDLTVGGQIQSSSSTMVLSPLPPGDGSAGVVESYGVLKVIDDDGFKITLSLQAADGLGQTSDTDPLTNLFKYTSLMLKDKLGATFPWLTLENDGSGGNLKGRTSIYCQNDLVMRLSSTNGVQAFYRVRCSDTTPSTSTTTGSITTAGGLGVVGDVKVGSGIQLFADNAVKPTSTTWTIASDIQFKEEIQDADLQRCADDISTLQLMRFKWKDDYITKYNVKDHHTLGFIAQDVQTKFPKSVDTIVEKDEVNDTGSRLGLDYHAINMSLIGAVQYLIKENQLLQDRISVLESRV